MHTRVPAVCLAFLSIDATGFRAKRSHENANFDWQNIDKWQDLADGLKLQSEADHLQDHPVFDWRAWGAEFEAKTFEQQADHLNAYHQQLKFLNSQTTTFKQRYWINTKAWAGAAAKGPIFIVISPYGGFNAYGYGFVGELSRAMGAMVVQVEGRFAPESLPFNVSGFDQAPNRIGLASSENALRDYIMLISYLRGVYDPEWVCPTATFGGSLAGMYAAWLRYKSPHLIDMAFASGSPMTGYPGTSDTLAFTRVITEAWLDASGDPECIDLVRESFKALQNTSCHSNLYSVIYNEATYKAYPPRGRIVAACQRALSRRAAGDSPVQVALALCGPECANDCPSGESKPSMWGYLSCTQVVNPIGSNGVQDFFWPPNPWNVEGRNKNCKARWGIETQREGNYQADVFGFHRLSQLADSVKRILFSFGSYDPWTGFALSTKDISEDLPVVVVKGGTHCADFAASVAEDTVDMRNARKRETEIIARWVREVQQRPQILGQP